jgi:hypothetical protein
MHKPVKVAHSSFIEGSHTTKNTASGLHKLQSTALTTIPSDFTSKKVAESIEIIVNVYHDLYELRNDIFNWDQMPHPRHFIYN